MEVITLSPETLIEKSKELAKAVIESQWTPELVIGIKTGGLYVAEPLVEELYAKNIKVEYTTISLSRPSTQKKREFNIGKILKKMPYFTLNILRNLEVFIIEQTKNKKYDSKKENDIPKHEQLIDQIKKTERILLVDDAIDTGSTVLAIKNFIHTIDANIEVKIAVLTTTHKEPYIKADFSLFKRVLLRCPWSEDYKESVGNV